MRRPDEGTLARIAEALAFTPTAAYSAPHDYPHAANTFEPAPRLARERVDADVYRLYAHVPFCNYACSFCCYAKKVGVEREQMARYVATLKRELEWIPEGTPVNQFFIGGGTPTALPADLLDELLGAIAGRMPYHGDPVHTVEASPESISDAHLAVLQRHGVRRVSMGVQSLDDEVLDSVRRSHGPDLALETCRRIIDAGLILNIDLIYGLPGQTHAGFRRDFQRVADAGVHAVTAYNLRLNERTPVSRALSPGERFDIAGLMGWRAFVRDTAAEFGFSQTRWHTFKRLDTIAARHQWLPTAGADMRGHQFGIGMSARSSLGHNVYRNHHNLETYMARVRDGESPVQEVIRLGPQDLRTQFIARSLGDGQVLSKARYAEVFGNAIEADHGETLARLAAGGLLADTESSVSLTEDGRLLHDLVTLSFYPGPARQRLLQRLDTFQLTDLSDRRPRPALQ
ncbi:coproporphyrinogen-III oxidase family protein [Alkalilimnicola ehrlichii MLHE-1]|nr:coproporphyrinogen-III oxidase family protein [Alkalilimnicola ehrlichii]